ncbi:hypothetical protein GALMADRAFT_148251 [Galerina marginata CBS 339.88]|uniref:Uncharacterized protein n=1 Tax=Galerina marginata (strain CBS 339.88) TaxID=685588 RepID=A0A067S7T6_GALM3|nr:hypothetical protein GALMADRAFT_148251 [Galerina marginata CBS 339.88]
MPVQPPGEFYVDAYGQTRSSATGDLKLVAYSRPNSARYVGTDALVIAEIQKSLNYAVPGLSYGLVGEDERGYDKPTGLIVTSPNMDWIPDLRKDSGEVLARTNGFFFMAKSCRHPQWYFMATHYLPFVLQPPPDDKISRHEHGLAWYTLTQRDFVFEEGSATNDLGRIRSELADSFVALRKELADKIKALVNEARYPTTQYDELLYCKTGMHYASVTLTFAPQTYKNTLLNVTSFQRYYLEALACYNYLTVWKKRELDLDPDKPYPVDKSVMSAITQIPMSPFIFVIWVFQSGWSGPRISSHWT